MQLRRFAYTAAAAAWSRRHDRAPGHTVQGGNPKDLLAELRRSLAGDNEPGARYRASLTGFGAVRH